MQQKTKSCNRGYATCACGVAIRAGQDVFMLNRCGRIYFIDFISCKEGGILDIIREASNKYKVSKGHSLAKASNVNSIGY